MHCPKCWSEDKVKSWNNNWKQRYKCKKCWCNYTKEELWKISIKVKIEALKMYLEWLWFRAIWRILKVSNVSVLNWIKIFWNIAMVIFNNLKELKLKQKFKKVELDEMWHYVKKKKKDYGFGLLANDEKQKLLTGLLELEEKKLDLNLKKKLIK